jgi:hypothetical protein
MKTGSGIKNIAEGRQISANSSDIDYFEPRDENV